MNTEYHNVILFGAGASFDAGIPLLNSFVHEMWNYAVRGKVRDVAISQEDRDILNQARTICTGLESYNSRANFDSRNLEDVLSLLSFEALSRKEHAEKYEALVKAVARTIELSCKIPYQENTPKTPPNIGGYGHLWHKLLSIHASGNPLALVTFNYDLVLERSLWDLFHHLNSAAVKPSCNSCQLKYFFGNCAFSIKSVPHQYMVPRLNPEPARSFTEVGTAGRAAEFQTSENVEVAIPFLKLHGSLNWSQDPQHSQEVTRWTKAVEKPVILPPVFNKMNTGAVNDLWGKALDVLRNAKRIIIVGYSLPKTDIYMQYFLKAAVGPNSNLEKIIVFDPVLFRGDREADEMRARYKECFANQILKSIVFNPKSMGDHNSGCLSHFSALLRAYPKELLFYP